MAVVVEWLEDWHAIAAAAGDTLDRAARLLLFDRLDWFRSLHRHMPDGRRLHVGRAADGCAVAWLFLIDGRDVARGSLRSLTTYYSLAWRPVVSGEPADGALVTALFRAAARRSGRLHLDAVPDDALDPTLAALRAAGWRAFASARSVNWSADVAGMSFDAYWAARPSRLRNTVARQSRRHPLACTIHRRFDPAAWGEYAAVYAASWKPAEGSLAFLRALAVAEGRAGTLRLGLAYDAEGRAVAAQLWLVEGGVATIHKLAHREDARQGSPGSILSHAMFRSAIDEDRVTRIDFGLGDDAYKADWMDAAHPVHLIEAYRPHTLMGAAGLTRRRVARLVDRLRGG